MSDFLSHLVAKSLDATEVLRPRSPGLFEPTKGGGGSLSREPLHSALAGAFDEPEATGLEDAKTAAGAPAKDDRSDMPHQPRKQFEFDWINKSPVAWVKRSETQEPEATGLEDAKTAAGAPVKDNRSDMPHQPRKQFEFDWINKSPVAWVKRSETQEPETRVDSIQAAPASSGANVPHGNLESALERVTRPFDPTRDSPALAEQRLTRLPESISRGSEEQLSPKNAPHITLRPRTSPAAERKDDEAVTPPILGEPVRQLAPKSTTKFIVVEEARPISTRQLNRSLSEQDSEATAAKASAALLDSRLRRNDDGSLTIADLIPLATVQSDLAPVQPARVSTLAVARPQVTRHVERFTQVPDAYTRGTPKTVPTIQVTIGRIEVRATPPPVQHTKKPNSAPPVMTLDDYLRQRSKEQGR